MSGLENIGGNGTNGDGGDAGDDIGVGVGALPNGVVAETDLDDDKKLLATAGTQARRAAFGPGGGIGIPAEKSERFGDTVRRLGELLGRERLRLVAVLFLVVSSVFLVVLGPKLLGEATNIIVEGASSPNGIDFGALHHQLEIVFVIYLALVVAVVHPVVHPRGGGPADRCTACANRSNTSSTACRCKYIDSQPRGDLLSRVTNDIDNLSQSLQQTISQILTSILTLIGVAIMMFVISPILAVIALSTVPVSPVPDAVHRRQGPPAVHGPVAAHWHAQRPRPRRSSPATRSSRASDVNVRPRPASAATTTSCTGRASAPSSSPA